MNSKNTYDVAIIGAGPAGCAAALELSKYGASVVLLEKAAFPREKVCGDAIPGLALKALNEHFPFFSEAFESMKGKQRIRKSILILNKGQKIRYNWQLPAYNIRRKDFDHFLLDLIKKHSRTEILSAWPVMNIEKKEEGILLSSNKSTEKISARMLIACDGARSVMERTSAHVVEKRPEHVVAIRGYYQGLGLDEDTNTFVIDRQSLPGYFWAFPLGEDIFNVGFGIKADSEGKTSLNLKSTLHRILEQSIKKGIFRKAEPLTGLKGGIIPLGGKMGMYHGEHFVMAGDAAHLADPLQGHGIDTAILSGIQAGEHAGQCIEFNEFGTHVHENYSIQIWTGIDRKARKNRKRQLLLTAFPGLLSVYSRFKK